LEKKQSIQLYWSVSAVVVAVVVVVVIIIIIHLLFINVLSQQNVAHSRNCRTYKHKYLEQQTDTYATNTVKTNKIILK